MSSESIDEAADELEDATENTSTKTEWFARAYILSLFIIAIGAVVGATYSGLFSWQITVTADVQLGWLVEYLAIAFAGLAVSFSVLMLVKAVGGHLLASVIRAVSRIADNYER